MNRSEALSLIIEALNVPPPAPTEETELSSLPAWDSMGQMSVIAAVDSAHRTILPPPQLRACQTIGDIIDLIEANLG